MRKRLAGGVLLVAAVVMVGGGAAQADCLSVEARVWKYGQPNPYRPLGQKYCVLPTPWAVQVDHWEDEWVVGSLPPGTPNGVGISVWVPGP